MAQKTSHTTQFHIIENIFIIFQREREIEREKTTNIDDKSSKRLRSVIWREKAFLPLGFRS